MNTVSQILKAKDNQVWTISHDATVVDALKLIVEKHIGSLIVMNDDLVVGIFTIRDHASKVTLAGKQPEKTTVQEVMTRNLTTVNPNQSVRDCMSLMTDKRIRHLPVFEGDKLVGIISIGDIVKDVIGELEFMVDQLENYITGFR
jgi:CBS domain-containing protein